MKYKCLKCGTEFSATMYVECPECHEQFEVEPVYAYQHAKTNAQM